MKNKIFCYALVGISLAGCFDGREKPADASGVTSLAALAATNRAEVVRLYLRRDKAPISSEALQGLTALKELDISERGLDKLPTIGGSIEKLWLARNKFTRVPAELLGLDKLTYLNLDGNRIAELPTDVKGWQNMRFLRLNDNQIKEFPAAFKELTNMRRLYACGNQLKAIPECVQAWPLLDALILDGNPIEEFPDWLTHMKALRSIKLSRTRISKLPEDLTALQNLESLNLFSCPIPEAEMRRIRKALPAVAIAF